MSNPTEGGEIIQCGLGGDEENKDGSREAVEKKGARGEPKEKTSDCFGNRMKHLNTRFYDS
jgi:hypothetical protein